jgi:hypothetical protein
MDEASLRLWWHTLPKSIAAVWPGLAGTLIEGLYPGSIAAASPSIGFCAGLVAGVINALVVGVLVQSIVVVGALLFVGTIFTGLAAWLLLGTFAGDFLYHLIRPIVPYSSYLTPSQIVLRALPLAIQYSLLISVVIFIPRYARAVGGSLDALRRTRLGGFAGSVARLLLMAVAGGLLVWAWVQAVPVLIRPLFTWAGASPLREAIQPMQTYGLSLVAVVIVALLAREVLARSNPGAMVPPVDIAFVRRRIALRARQYLLLGLPVRISLQAALTAFLLSGLLTSWTEALLLVALLVLFYCLRFGVIVTRGRPLTWIHSFPVVARLCIWAGSAYILSFVLLHWQWQSEAGLLGFRPLLFAVGASAVVYAVLFPIAKRPHDDAQEASL